MYIHTHTYRWVFRDVVRIDAKGHISPTGPLLVHASCYTQASR